VIRRPERKDRRERSRFLRFYVASDIQALGAVFVVVSAQFGPWLPTSDEEMDDVSPQRSRTPWADDFAILKRLWADDFTIVARPEWPLADIYIPPWCCAGSAWTAKAYWPR
jgi:hypothetical protein